MHIAKKLAGLACLLGGLVAAAGQATAQQSDNVVYRMKMAVACPLVSADCGRRIWFGNVEAFAFFVADRIKPAIVQVRGGKTGFFGQINIRGIPFPADTAIESDCSQLVFDPNALRSPWSCDFTLKNGNISLKFDVSAGTVLLRVAPGNISKGTFAVEKGGKFARHKTVSYSTDWFDGDPFNKKTHLIDSEVLIAGTWDYCTANWGFIYSSKKPDKYLTTVGNCRIYSGAADNWTDASNTWKLKMTANSDRAVVCSASCFNRLD